ncbi:MAG: diguanylate cyclase and serine/threonine protein kinase with repeat [Chitinophagaceae bacterium]|nr:diguanylate cyclase and serine/threonine protein kinase with repeat [Chitinophagaceae bacterium]
MEEKLTIAQLEEKLQQATDEFTKIDWQNRIAFELHHIDAARSTSLAEAAHQKSSDIHYEKGLADSLSILGFHKLQLSDIEQAFEYLLRAIYFYKKTGAQKEISFPLYILGITHSRLSNYEKALDLFLESQKISAAFGDKAQEAKTLINMARIYSYFKDLPTAIQYALQSLAYARELKDQEQERYTLMVTGMIYLNANDFEHSIQYFNESIQIPALNGELGNHITYSRIAKWHEKQGQYDIALQHYEKLLNTAIRIKHTYVQVVTMIDMGSCYKKIHRLQEAKRMLQEAFVIAQSKDYKGLLLDIHKEFCDIFKAEQNYTEAFAHLEQVHALKEEVYNSETAARIKNILVINQLESAAKDAEIERLRNVELKNANDELDRTNKELTETIDELTRVRISKFATSLTLLVAIGLFILSEGLLDPIVDSYSQNVWINLASKLMIALLLKPIETFFEKLLLSYAAKRKKENKKIFPWLRS